MFCNPAHTSLFSQTFYPKIQLSNYNWTSLQQSLVARTTGTAKLISLCFGRFWKQFHTLAVFFFVFFIFPFIIATSFSLIGNDLSKSLTLFLSYLRIKLSRFNSVVAIKWHKETKWESFCWLHIFSLEFVSLFKYDKGCFSCILLQTSN